MWDDREKRRPSGVEKRHHSEKIFAVPLTPAPKKTNTRAGHHSKGKRGESYPFLKFSSGGKRRAEKKKRSSASSGEGKTFCPLTEDIFYLGESECTARDLQACSTGGKLPLLPSE